MLFLFLVALSYGAVTVQGQGEVFPECELLWVVRIEEFVLTDNDDSSAEAQGLVTELQCMQLCQAELGFVCLSVQYVPSQQRCFLSAIRREDVDVTEIRFDELYVYRERQLICPDCTVEWTKPTPNRSMFKNRIKERIHGKVANLTMCQEECQKHASCLHECQNKNSALCVGVDYNEKTKRCFLLSTTSTDAPGDMMRSPGVVHFDREFICNNTLLCEPNPCMNGGTCSLTVTGFVCKCPRRFGGSRCHYEPLKCQAWGDPHYRKFLEKKRIDFMGKEKYPLLVRKKGVTSIPDFQVLEQNEMRKNNPKVSYVRYVEVTLGGYTVKIGPGLNVFLDGVKKPPMLNLPLFSVFESGLSIRLETSFDLVVTYTYHKTTVLIPPDLYDLVTGLCVEFIPDKNFTTFSGCTEEEISKLPTNEYCGLIRDTKGPFADCIANGGADVINSAYRQCETNVTADDCKRDGVCASLEAFALTCMALGFPPKITWRRRAGCVPPVCRLWGDPHVKPFNGRKFEFMEVGTFVAVESKAETDIPPFRVSTYNEHRNRNLRVSYVCYVEIELGGHVIKLGPGLNVLIDTAPVLFQELDGTPINDTLFFGLFRVVISGKWVRFSTPYGLLVNYSLRRTSIIMPPFYLPYVEGLCVVVDEKVPLVEVPPCEADVQALIESNLWCGMMRDESGPFAECIEASRDSVQAFYASCEFDIQATGCNRDTLCPSLVAFAATCEQLGFNPSWREVAGCPAECPVGLEYMFSATACPATCSDADAPSQCPLEDVESCVCPADTILNGDQCVPPESCGCYDGQANHYEIGQTWTEDTCKVQQCRTCQTCDQPIGQIIELSAGCSWKEVCQPNDGTFTCVAVPMTSQVRFGNSEADDQGLVLVLFKDEWRPVCADGWGDDEAAVVCRMQKYNLGGTGSTGNHFGDWHASDIGFYGVDCKGSENEILDCTIGGYGDSNCEVGHEANVFCHIANSTVILVNGNGAAEGMVYVTYNGATRAVCDDLWDDEDATVVCRQLGFDLGGVAIFGSAFGEATVDYGMDGVRCAGTEQYITDCVYNGWGVNDCGNGEAASVRCTESDKPKEKEE